MHWWKFYKANLLYVRVELSYFLAIAVPQMHYAIFTTRHNKVRIGGEIAFYYRRFIQKICDFAYLCTLKRIQNYNTVIGGSQKNSFPIITESHNFDLVVVFAPIRKRPSLASLQSIEANSHNLLVFLLLRPGYPKSYSCGIEAGYRASWHTYSLHIQLKIAL